MPLAAGLSERLRGLTVPQIQPDEFVTGWVAAFVALNPILWGKYNLHRFVLDTAGKPKPSLSFASQISLASTALQCTEKEIFDNHTLSGFTQRSFEDMRSPATIGRAGLLGSDPRWCFNCGSEELATIGRTKWHRIHQVPGVYACPRHKTRLIVQSASCGRGLLLDMLALPTELRAGAQAAGQVPSVQLELTPFYARYLSFAEWAVGQGPRIGRARVRDVLRHEMRERYAQRAFAHEFFESLNEELKLLPFARFDDWTPGLGGENHPARSVFSASASNGLTAMHLAAIAFFFRSTEDFSVALCEEALPTLVHKPLKRMGETELLECYVAKGGVAQAIARGMGYARNSVRNRLISLGLPMLSKAKALSVAAAFDYTTKGMPLPEAATLMSVGENEIRALQSLRADLGFVVLAALDRHRLRYRRYFLEFRRKPRAQPDRVLHLRPLVAMTKKLDRYWVEELKVEHGNRPLSAGDEQRALQRGIRTFGAAPIVETFLKEPA